MPASNRFTLVILPITLGGVCVYSAYVYLLQTSSLTSSYRYAAAITIWAVLSVYLRLRWSQLRSLVLPGLLFIVMETLTSRRFTAAMAGIQVVLCDYQVDHQSLNADH